jgi:hypothetical protein
MKNNNKKTSLAVLSVLAGIIYFITLIPYCEAGYEGGIRNVKENHKTQADGVYHQEIGSRVLQNIQLKPKNNEILYSDSIVNIKNGKMMPVSYTRMYVNDNSKGPNTIYHLILDIIVFFGGFSFFVIPFLFYKLILSFYKDQIFTLKNIRRIKALGILYLILFVTKFAYNLGNYYIDKSTIELQNYIIVKPNLAYDFLLIAILLFIIGIVMSRVMIMKEEQDLTI